MWLLRAITRIINYMAKHDEDRFEVLAYVRGDKQDLGPTQTGRFSSSDVNLPNQPKSDRF